MRMFILPAIAVALSGCNTLSIENNTSVDNLEQNQTRALRNIEMLNNTSDMLNENESLFNNGKSNASLVISKDENSDELGQEWFSFHSDDIENEGGFSEENKIRPTDYEKIQLASNGVKEVATPETPPELEVNFQEGESLKHQLNEVLNSEGYKLLWKTDKNVIFDGNITYKGDTILLVLKQISDELARSGIDIHMNVYTKNNVVLVYSVRG
ncbi:TcpQ domain-containing protein [Enterovibrio coralii]|uniref:Toxin co-regulated pilus biosynthesis protein Q C-terminal domain-containing protein n=1 Tax=Enterovibrio coralii TaxID=294935 RepID=A0A135I5S7_9GAMM|nr:TcpQ domain-containing protein [Enterovibrio coralii]KXF80791.1 hypothetical protein ATN88_16055 [Enterovibrio coralii]